jgi:hypothetical protein
MFCLLPTTDIGEAVRLPYAVSLVRPLSTLNEGEALMKSTATMSILGTALVSCATSSTDTPDLVYITTERTEVANDSEAPYEFVGFFKVYNTSSRSVCLNEDVFVNKLSPHVDVSDPKTRRPAGLPHPPKTLEIARIAPGGSREFQRVVGYATPKTAVVPHSVISVRLWDCEIPGTFVRRAKLAG